MAHNVVSLLVPSSNTCESFALDTPRPHPAMGVGSSRFCSVRVGVQPLALHDRPPKAYRSTWDWEMGTSENNRFLQMCVATWYGKA